MANVCLLVVLGIFVCSACSFENMSSKKTLREMIRNVSEIVDVFPLDVYMGTTLEDYRNWDCRYDLSYAQFRPHYALYMAAQNASFDEVRDILNDFEKMTAKEKALTCALLIAFERARRESDKDQALRKDEKEWIVKKLETKLADESVAFSKIVDADLAFKWECNIQKEAFYFMNFFRNGNERINEGAQNTLRHLCCDLYLFSCGGTKAEKDALSEKFAKKIFYTFDTWENENNTFPVKFLCAIVLAQAAYDCSLYFPQEKHCELENPMLNQQGGWEHTKRDAVVKCFMRARTSIINGDFNPCDYEDRCRVGWGLRDFLKDVEPGGEVVIMDAYLRTQYIASRFGGAELGKPVNGNSTEKDVLVSNVIQKTIDFFE